MKIIIILTLLFFSLSVKAQYPLTQTLGSDSTLVWSKGGFKGRIVNLNFIDTAQANTQRIKQYPGAQIFTSNDNLFWYRNAAATQWLRLTGSNSSSATACNNLLSGGVVAWNRLLKFDITPAIYYISCKQYTSNSDSVTLSTADTANPRIDVIALDTNGHAVVITGVANSNPATPQINPASQLYLTSVFVPANATQPACTGNLVLYNEGNEWLVGSVGFGTLNPVDPQHPYSQTVSIILRPFTDGNSLTFNEPSNTLIPITTYSSLILHIRLKQAIPNPVTPSIQASWYQTLAGVGTVSSIVQIDNAHGFNKNVVNTYQTIIIPIADWSFSKTQIHGLRLQFTGSNTDSMFVDLVQLQSTGDGSCMTPTSATGNFETADFKKDGTDSVFHVVGGVPRFSFIDAGGQTNNGDTIINNKIGLGGALIRVSNITASNLYSLNFTGTTPTTTNTGLVTAVNSGSAGNGFYGQATDGRGVYGVSATGVGAYGLASGSGIGVFGNGNSGHGGYFQSVTGIGAEAIVLPSSTSTIVNVLKLSRTTTGTAANGEGGSIEFHNEMVDGVNYFSNSIVSKVTNVVVGSRTTDLELYGVNATTTGRKALFSGNGDVTFDGYPSTRNDGAISSGSTKIVYVDANGKLQVGTATFATSGGFTTADNGLTASTTTNVQWFGTSGTPATLLDDRYLTAADKTINITFNSLAGTAGFNITSSSTTATTNQKGINVALSGANALSSQSTYGIYSSNTHTGSGTNYGGYFTASGGTLNFAVRAESSDYIGVYAVGGAQGISGNSTSGTGVVATSSSSYGIQINSISGVGAYVNIDPSSTNSVATLMDLYRSSSSTPASGLGGSIDFYLESATQAFRLSNQIITKWITPTDATRTSQFEIWGVNSAASAVKFIVKGSGIINIATDPPSYTTNALALAGGLVVGDIYRNGDIMQIVHVP